MSIGSKIVKMKKEMELIQQELTKQANEEQLTVSESESKAYKQTANAVKQLNTLFEISSEFLLDLSEVITEINKTLLNVNSIPKNEQQNISIDDKIANILITIGISTQLKGYNLLRDAIKVSVRLQNTVNYNNKHIYAEVAQKYNLSPKNVERNIYHAIEVAWKSGKILNLNSIFEVELYNINEKPSNGELIALIADKLHLENN